MQQHQVLTLKNRKWHLFGVKPKLDGHWEKYDGHFITTSLSAAIKYRHYSDEIAKKYFSRILVREDVATNLSLPNFLDPHQVEGVRFILSRSRTYLAHAPGAGKTLTTIMASLVCGTSGQTVIIVPPTLTMNWAREIAKFTDDFGFYTTTIIGRSEHRHSVNWDADYILVPDSMLDRPWVLRGLKRPIRLLAIDEASRFKNAEANRSKALYGGLLQRAKRVVFLDGSPMPNRPMELWAPIYGLDPEAIDCMTQQDFGFRYCGPVRNEMGAWEFPGSHNEAELSKRLKRVMQVVSEENLSHPERRRSIVFTTEVPKSAKHKNWLAANINISELDEDDSQGVMAVLRHEVGVAKIPWLTAYIKELQEKNESILLFVWHREVAERLHQKLGGGLVIGGTKEREREKIFEQFQSGKLRLIIGNIQAMGRGHNLQKADRVIFGEFSWTDELNKQCEKRASRRGSNRHFVRCEYVVAPSTIDEKVAKTLFEKERRVKKVVG